jgi:hypothetical protein
LTLDTRKRRTSKALAGMGIGGSGTERHLSLLVEQQLDTTFSPGKGGLAVVAREIVAINKWQCCSVLILSVESRFLHAEMGRV